MISDLFTCLVPDAAANAKLSVPIIANLPHSGLGVPPDIAQQFTPQHLQTLPNSDWHLQPLYSFLPSLGVTILQANYSRYVVDLNRALKPPLFGSFWSAVVPEQTAYKQPIYKPGCLPSALSSLGIRIV
ncbi:MAG: N-formylglutamate amidohydrolase [Cyanobacteria bacterium P01_D01_bin.105]